MRMRASFRPGVERLEAKVLLSAGDLDPFFGIDGQVLTDFTGARANPVQAVVRQPDDQVVVVGRVGHERSGWQFALARYGPDGTLDKSFGTGGRVTTGFAAAATTVANGVALQPDGKIVVVGYTSDWPGGMPQRLAVARYHSDGTLDEGFGTAGRVTTVFPGATANLAYGVTVQPDGRIVVAGSTGQNRENRFGIVRYLADGRLDPDFGGGGLVTTDFPIGTTGATAVLLQPDGKLVAGGWDGNTSNGNFALARYHANGTLDATFGSGGRVSTTMNNWARIEGLVLQPDGQIVAAGTGGGDFALARYHANGTLDATFGSGGRVFTNFGTNYDFAYGLALQADGQLVVTGGTLLSTGRAISPVVRYLPDGTLDSSFGKAGSVIPDFGEAAAAGRGVVETGQGQFIVAVTTTFPGQDADFSLVGLNADGSPDKGFGQGGLVSTDFPGPHSNRAQAAALQTDGKIVVAGSVPVGFWGSAFLVARYLSDGNLDPEFGIDGQVLTSFQSDSFPRQDTASGVVVQPDGKLVVAGVSVSGGSGEAALARYEPDGTLDLSFGTDGKVLFRLFSPPRLGSFTSSNLVLQFDGKLVLAAGGDESYQLVRFDDTGRLDPSFGLGGRVPLPGREGATLLLQPDGQIVVAMSGFGSLQLARYDADGRLDPNFGTFTRDLSAAGLILQADGKLVVAGWVRTSPIQASFRLARYQTDGRTLDPTFGSEGLVTTDFGDGEALARGVVQQADGWLVVVGRVSGPGQTPRFALARYEPDGSLDSTFGSDGRVTTLFGSGGDGAAAVVVQDDGNLVVAGTAFDPETRDDFALGRYLAVDHGGSPAPGHVAPLAIAEFLQAWWLDALAPVLPPSPRQADPPEGETTNASGRANDLLFAGDRTPYAIHQPAYGVLTLESVAPRTRSAPGDKEVFTDCF